MLMILSNVSINLRVEMVGVQILTASEWVHFLYTVQLPERSPGCKSRLGKYIFRPYHQIIFYLSMKNEGFLAKKMTISNRSIQSGPRA